jgi:hypothetical protein
MIGYLPLVHPGRDDTQLRIVRPAWKERQASAGDHRIIWPVASKQLV